MNLGMISFPNSKGQVVIPKDYRDKLAINEHVPLNIVLKDYFLAVYPVRDVKIEKPQESGLTAILKKTQGNWCGDDWEATRRKRTKIELQAANASRKTKW